MPNRLSPNKAAPRHYNSVVKSQRQIILRTAREKGEVIYKETPIRILVDFSTETFQVRREWDDIFKILKESNHQLRIQYLVKLSFRNEGGIQTPKQTEAEEVHYH